MKEQPSYYAILTADVRYSKELSFFEKVLYADITALTNKNGYCTATNGYFAELFDKSRETVSRSISKFEKLGFLKVVIKRDKITKQVINRKLYLLMKTSIGVDENVNTPLDENVNTPLDENVKENNTSNNNTSINIKNNKKENPIFSEFLKELKESATFKSKITKTKEGSEFFDKIENKEKLKIDYLNHQLEFGNFAKKITPFLEDYNTVSQLLTKPNSLQIQKTKNPTQIFVDIYQQTGRSDFAFLQASQGLSYQEQGQLEKFQRDFELEIIARKIEQKRELKQ